jgi:hypothetical protein
VCPRAGFRRIAFHSRGCVEPLRSEEEEICHDVRFAPEVGTNVNAVVLAQSLGAQLGKVREGGAELLLCFIVQDQGFLGCVSRVSVFREVEDPCDCNRKGKCCLLVLISVTSTQQWIRQPKPCGWCRLQ